MNVAQDELDRIRTQAMREIEKPLASAVRVMPGTLLELIRLADHGRGNEPMGRKDHAQA